MAVIDLKAEQDLNDPQRKRGLIDLKTGDVTRTTDDPAVRVGELTRLLGGTPEDEQALLTGNREALSEGFTSRPLGAQTAGRVQELGGLLQDTTQYQHKPQPTGDESPMGRGFKQGLLNIGGGILRATGELRQALGDEGAAKFLKDLEVSQTMERGQTTQITEGHPVQGFVGEVGGEIAGFPVGGGAGSIPVRLATGAAGGATAAGLSAAGRGEDVGQIGTEAALGAGLAPISEIGAMGLGRLAQKRNAAKLGGLEVDADRAPEVISQMETAQRAKAETGIHLLPAQQSLDPFQLEKQAFLGQNPEVSIRAFDVLKQQNKEAATAVSNLLDKIATPGAVGSSGTQARAVANNVIDTAKRIRSEKASPLYREAFEQGADVDLLPVHAVVKDILDGLPPKGGKMRGAVTRVQQMLKGGKKNPLTLKQLQGAKLEIDEMISAKGENGLGPTTKRYLTDIQTALLGQMDAASPAYSEARAAFRQASPAVNELREGVFGRLSKLKDTDLKRASGILFDATESNPEVLRNAIKALKSVEGGTEVARGLLRSELEKRLGRMRVDLADAAKTGGRKVENTPLTLLNNLFGNASQKKLLLSALDELAPEAGRNARWLEEGLSRAAGGRPGGSQTGIRQVISEQLRGVGLTLRDFLRRPVTTVTSVGEAAAYDHKVRAVGDLMYDPDWAPDMARLRKLDPNGEAAQNALDKLLRTVLDVNTQVKTGARGVTTATRKTVAETEDD